MKILEISRLYEDGKMDIKTEGQQVYQILNFRKKAEEKMYPTAEVIYLQNEESYQPELVNQILKGVQKIFTLLKGEKSVDPFRDNFKSYMVAHHVGLSENEKIKLLTLRSENQRLQFILEHLQRFIPALLSAEKIKERAALNGHFKNLESPDF